MKTTNSKKLKILMVTNHFYPSQGGMERQAQRLATQLIKKGHSVDVLTPKYCGLPTNEKLGNIQVVRFPIMRCPHVRYDFKSKLKYAISLTKHIWTRRNEIDVLHVQQALFAAFVCIIVAKVIRKKVIVKVACSGVHGDLNALNNLFWGGKMMLSIIRGADAFVSLSPETTNELLENCIPANKIAEIPNGISIEEYTTEKPKFEIREQMNIQQDTFTCIFTGRLATQKNLHFLLKAWKIFCGKNENTLLLLVGDGPDRESLEMFSIEHGIEKKVKFVGHINNIVEVLACSDCFILPSVSEGMSNSILEAMTAGITCIASNIPANSNLICHQENGLLFDISDANNLAEAISLVYNDQSLSNRLKTNAKITINQKYGIDTIAEMYLKLYQNC